MDTSKLKPFAQEARRTLRAQVSARLDLVLAEQSAARREQPKAVAELESEIARTDRDQVVERVAYTWFNRFTALRFMDANGYTRLKVVSPAEGQTRPEILAEAAAGNIDDDAPAAVREKVAALLDGRMPSADAQGESYRLLLVAACNQWHAIMPFMFEKIADYTELLLPEDLLSAESLLGKVRTVMTEDACQDVEIIGWLYQFYISEKKDEVFAGLKKSKKITAENIPAATQLFTPHWIVRYLVENSLGRLWLLNRPTSQLAAKMEYYIAPEKAEADFLRISRPEDIRICDPACGSGHMLTYAFDLLYAIYEEEGYEASEIPGLILMHNLHGIEIDDRAGGLAAFALAMKAATKLGRRRFMRQAVLPNICVLQDVRFTPSEMQDVASVVGSDLFTAEFRQTMGQFEQAKNFGSLIVPILRDPAEVARIVRSKDFGGDLLLREVQARVLNVLEMAEALTAKYHVVVANPPYMNASGMNVELKKWISTEYSKFKSDFMTCFMHRSSELCKKLGFWSVINLPSWMFLTTFQECRDWLIDSQSISSLLHLGRGVFGSDFGSVAFSCQNKVPGVNQFGIYRRLFERHVQVRSPEEIEKNFRNHKSGYFEFNQNEFRKIPNHPIAYWVSESVVKCFSLSKVGDFAEGEGKNVTADNARFLRFFWEVERRKVGEGARWLPYAKGGPFRKWAGNMDYLVDWGDSARRFYRSNNSSRLIEEKYWYREGITWTDITSGGSGFRVLPCGSTYDTTGISFFLPADVDLMGVLATLNSKPCLSFLPIINPTLHANLMDVKSLPLPGVTRRSSEIAKRCHEIVQDDWDESETSSGFLELPLIKIRSDSCSMRNLYALLREKHNSIVSELGRLEHENNVIFIEAYGLSGELSPDVAADEITVGCNLSYRYGSSASEEAAECRFRFDTISDLLSYAVGCMFGRFSLDEPGFILADKSEGLTDYLARIQQPTFKPDFDNVIPVLDGEWFVDDITERFRKFLRVAFGDEHFIDNLAFIEESLGKDVRRYFTRDFFNDHVKRYKKRPIYWMFSSPKGSFQALIYMHRYQSDTVSVVLNDYLREYRNKLEAHRKAQEALSISTEASPAQRSKALKEIGEVSKVIDELDGYERDVLFPLATQKIEIDLDDGVKANYPKFGAALKPIKGLGDADD